MKIDSDKRPAERSEQVRACNGDVVGIEAVQSREGEILRSADQQGIDRRLFGAACRITPWSGNPTGRTK